MENKYIKSDVPDLNLENLKNEAILVALKKSKGNRKVAAETLGISERTLYRLINDSSISEDLKNAHLS